MRIQELSDVIERSDVILTDTSILTDAFILTADASILTILMGNVILMSDVIMMILPTVILMRMWFSYNRNWWGFFLSDLASICLLVFIRCDLNFLGLSFLILSVETFSNFSAIAWTSLLKIALSSIAIVYPNTVRPLVNGLLLPRCYLTTDKTTLSTQLHGLSACFRERHSSSDVHEKYTCWSDHNHLHHSCQVQGGFHQAKLFIDWKLTGVLLLAKLMDRVCTILGVPVSQVYTRCDSTTVLSGLDGRPRKVCGQPSKEDYWPSSLFYMEVCPYRWQPC